MTDIRQAVEAEIPGLRRYALKLTRDRGVADELVQECIVRGLGKQHLWREGTNLRAWLFTILHNQYVNGIRRSMREGYVAPLSELDQALFLPPAQDMRLKLHDVHRALEALPKTQRTVVTMVGIDGLDYDKVASMVGVPVGTVRSRLSRGRQKLRMAA